MKQIKKESLKNFTNCLHPRNPHKYTDYYSCADPGGNDELRLISSVTSPFPLGQPGY